MRVLTKDTYVKGRRFRIGDTPPPYYADHITNPAAWITIPDGPDDDGPNDDVPAAGDPPEVDPNIPPMPLPAPVDPDPAPPGPSDPTPPAPGQPAPRAATLGDPPPRTGKGSGTTAWTHFATRNNVAVPADAERPEIIAACIAAGLIGEHEA